MDELDGAYALLARARDDRDWDATRCQLAAIARLHASLRETEATSVIGAAHLLREAAALLLRSNSPYYGDRLRDVAGRLDEGERLFSDLVWLRGVRQALSAGDYGRPGENAAGLIALALKGASRPILLYRSVTPPPPRHSQPLRSETHG
jgi:hypothetical protein